MRIFTNFTKHSLVLLYLLLLSTSAWSQSTANYAFSTNTTGSLASDANGNTVDMTTGTTQLLGSLVDATVSSVTPISFDFYFMGNRYTQFSASADGLVGLGATALTSSTKTCASGTTATPRLSALVADLYVGSGGKVHYKIVGNAPSRCIVIEFTNMAITYNTTAANANSTYQVRLYESTGVVEYVYGFMNCTSTTYNPVYAGFSTGTAINTTASITYSTNTVSNAATFNSNTLALGNITNLHSTANGLRRVYKFTPPLGTPADPTTLTFSAITAGSTTVNWVDNSTNESGFVVTSATDPTFTTGVVTTSVASTTSAATGGAYNSIITGLIPSTTYYYKIQAINEGTVPGTGITGSQATGAASVYTWTATGSAPWTTAASWTPARSTPDATDILQFTNGGSVTVTSIPTQTVGQVVFGGNTTANFQAAAASTLTMGKLTIPVGSTLLSNGTTAALTMAFSAGAINAIDGRLEISNIGIANGITFANSVTTISATGTLAVGGTNAATVTGTTTTLVIQGTYEHKYTTVPGTVPTATWADGSNCNIIGYTTVTAHPSYAQSFWNFTWNCTSQTAAITGAISGSWIVRNNLNLLSTGTTGTFTNSGTSTYAIKNIIMSAGTFNLASSTGTYNITGDFTKTGGTMTPTGVCVINFAGTSPQLLTLDALANNSATWRFSNAAGVTITGTGSFPSSFPIGNGTTGGVRISTTASTPITFSGTITNGFAYNVAGSTLTFDATGNVTASAAVFPASSGPLNLVVNIGSVNVLTLPFNRTISGTLTMTSGDIDINSNTLTLGTSTTVLGTLTWTAGNIRLTTGSMARWFGTSGLPTTPGTGIGYFPLATGTNNRNVSVYFSSATGLTTGGTITLSHTNVGGLSIVSPSFLEGSETIDTKSNSSWTVAQSGLAGIGTVSLRLTGGGAVNTSTVAKLHMILATSVAAPGTHSAGTGTSPNFQVVRTAIPIGSLANSYTLGANAVDVVPVCNSIASGDWNDPLTWDSGVPSCANVVNIMSGHTVSIGSLGNNCKTLTINTGATLTQSNKGSLTIGCTNKNNTFAINGALLLNGGTINVNGNLSVGNVTGSFIQNAGSLILDANDAGSTATSATSHLFDAYANSPSLFQLNGGSITIVDPPVSTTTTNMSFKVFPQNGAINASTNHTLKIGDGTSTDAGGNTSVGYGINLGNSGTNQLILGNLEINVPTSANANRFVTSNTNAVGVSGSLTVTSGEYRMATAHYIKGDITVNTPGILSAVSTLYLGDYTSAVFATSPDGQTIGGTGTFQNFNTGTAATANLSSLQVNNLSLTLTKPLNISGTLTMTSGVVNTTGANYLQLGTSTAAGTLVCTPSNTNMIAGPFARTFASSRTATGTYTVATLFPVGKTNVSTPIYVDPSTTSGGAVIITAEGFDTNSGSAGAGVSNLSTKTWSASATTGAGNFINAFIRVTDTGIGTNSKLLHAATIAGVYDGTPGGSTSSAGSVTSASSIPSASYLGNFAYGDLIPCPAPTDAATTLTASLLTSTTFTGTITAAPSNPTGYLVVRYAAGGSATTPTDGTLYTAAAALGTGTVVGNYYSPTLSFNQTGLTAGTTYDYKIYSFNNSGCTGPTYYATPLATSVTTCAATTGTPGTPTATSITTTSMTISWTASSTSGVDYEIDVATNSGFTTFVPGYQALNLGTGTLTTNLMGLTSATTYYVRVRAVISGCYSASSGTLTVVTECDPVTTFSQNFDSALTGSTAIMPTCYKRYTGTSGSSYVTTSSTSPWSPSNRYYIFGGGTTYNGPGLILPNISNLNSGTHRLRFKAYTATASPNNIIEVGYIIDPTDISTYTAIQSVTVASAMTSSILEVIPTTSIPTANAYLMLRVQNSASSYAVYLDDIIWEPIPICSGTPNGGTINAVQNSTCGVNNTTTLTSTYGTYSEGLGITYQWQSSTDNFVNVINDIQGAYNPVSTLSSTFVVGNNYYRLKVTCSNSNLDAYSNTVTVNYSNPSIASSVPASRCGVGTVNLSATPTNVSDQVNWYAGATGGAPLGTGATFTTPSISTTTNFYASATSGLSVLNVSKATYEPTSSATVLTTYGQDFTVTNGFTLNTVKVFSTTGTSITVSLYSAGGTTQLQTTGAQSVVAGSSPDITCGWYIAPGTYRLCANGMTGNFYRDNTNVTYPFTLGTVGTMNGFVASITGSVTTTSSYYFLYNWNISVGCEGTRTAVAATVNAPPSISASASMATICNGASTTLSASSSNAGYAYSWSNGAGSGASVSVTPTITTTYTVSATDVSGGAFDGCATNSSITINVNALPVVTATSSATSVCAGSSVTLNASPTPIPYTLGAGATTSATYSNPFYSLWSNLHAQYLVKASELTALGLSAGNISALGIDLTSAGTLPMINLSVKIGHTSAVDMATFASPTFTTVYSSGSLMPVLGINTLNFATPFTWDGTSNIVIEFCHGNASSSATMSRTCKGDNTSFVSAIKTHVSAATAAATICGDVTTNILTYSFRPKFTFTQPDNVSNFTWSWSDGSSQVLSASSGTVTPTATTTYFVSATSNATTCTGTSSVIVGVDPTTVAGTTSGTMCFNTSTNSGSITLSGQTGSVVRWESATDAVFTTPVTIANTTTTFNYTNVATTTYYRAVVKSGSCNELPSTSVEIKIGGCSCEASSGNGLLSNGSNTLNTMCMTGASTYTYYGVTIGATQQYCLAIDWGTNAASKAYAETNSTISMFKSSTGNVSSGTSGVSGTATLGYYWNVDLTGGPQLAAGAPVSVRFYYPPADLAALSTLATSTYGGTASSPVWFKTDGVPFSYGSPSVQSTGQWIGMVTPTASGPYVDSNGQTYIELSGITSFSGGSVAVSAGVASPLPINLKTFTAREKGSVNQINWETSVETNVRSFEVEKSNDGKVWTKLGSMNPNQTKRYEMIDGTPSTTTYYRLKNIDNDGRTDVSSMVVVNRKTGRFTLTSVSPNPTSSDLTVKYESSENTVVTMNILDIFGRVLLTQKVDATKGFNKSVVNTSELPAGAYFLNINDGINTLTQRVVKQ